MVARRSRVGFRRSSVRRRTGWNFGPGTTGAIQSASASGALLFTEGSAATLDGLTLVRIRGDLLISLATAANNAEGYFGAVGIGQVTAEAFGVGITAIPTPVADDNDEIWIWHQYFHLNVGSSSIVNDVGRAAIRYQVDSKAMRKSNLGDVIFMAAEFTEVGTSIINFQAQTRVLDKLP